MKQVSSWDGGERSKMNKRNRARNSVALILLATIMIAIVAPAYFAPVYAQPPPNPGVYIVTDLGALPNVPQALWIVPPPAGPPVLRWPDGPLVSPTGVAVGAPWNIVVADAGPPPTLFMVPPAPGAPVAIPIAGPLVNPSDVAIDAAGNIIVTDLGPAPAVFMVPPVGPPVPVPIVGPWVSPTGVAVGAPWNIVVADAGPPPTLFSVNPAGAVVPILVGGPLVSPTDVAIDALGNIIVTDVGGPWKLFMVNPAGQPAPIVVGAPLVNPTGVAVDAAGNYVVADQAAAMLFIVSPAGAWAPIGGFTKPDDVAVVSPFTCIGSSVPASGNAPLAVSFTASPSGGLPPYTYLWTFGDGGSNATQNPIHIYQNSGTYNWTLTASDNVGQQASANGTVTVSGPHSVFEFRDDVLNVTSGAAWYVLGDYVLHRNDGTKFRDSDVKHSPVVAAIATDIFAAQYLMGGSSNPQNAILDTNSAYISQADGDFGNATIDGPIVTVGGPLVSETVYYYMYTSNETQLFWDSGAGAIKRRDTGATVTSETSNATKDFFVVESFVDSQGRVVYMFWGRGARGTMAATCFMMEVLLKPSNPYGDTSWFVVRWNEASSGPSVNSFPDAGDTYTVLASGPSLP